VRSIVVVGVALAVVLVVLYVTQRSLIYFPGSTGPSVELLPAGAEVVELHTDDGLRLTAGSCRPSVDPIGLEPSRRLVRPS
jgi:hypothetical protein